MTIRILYTKKENGYWTPLYLHNINKDGLLGLLMYGIGSLKVTRYKTYTIIKGLTVSDTPEPEKLYKKDLVFHSIMLNDGLIYDTTINLDYTFYQKRNFGMPAKRFEELWKSQSADVYNSWMIEVERKRKVNRTRARKKRRLKRKEKNNE